VHRDTLRPKTFTVLSHLKDVWVVAATRIADGCHFIDVYTKSGHIVVLMVSGCKDKYKLRFADL
jgi:hypothetical protein